MPNPIRKKLSSHAAKGYSRITAAEADLKEIYLRARDYVERRLATFLQEKNASFTGPRLVSLFDDISSYFSDFEQEYCETYEEALSYMAKQNYAVALHDMGLEENIVGSMDKALFENMKADAFTHIAGATKRMQTDVISNLRKMSAKVMREAALTGMTRSEVSRKLAFENGYGTGSLFQQPGKKGSDFQFIDAAGKKWKTDAYFNMLGRTLLHNNARECYLAGCAKAGSDIVTISISGDPCEVCAKYENTLLSISGRTKGLVTLEQAMAEGLFHPNCTHRMVAVPESVAKEYYDKDGKEKAEKDVAREKHLAHQEKRKKQREQAKENRTKREAEFIGAELIKGEHTREQDLMAVNPNFNSNKNGIWENNCQRCVTAYEARRRGIIVTVKPCPPLTQDDYLSRYCGWGDAYKNGTMIPGIASSGNAAKNKVIKEISQMPDGARCAVQILYKGGGGHVFVAEKDNGKILFIDPQPNGHPNMFDQSGIFSYANGRGCFVMRLDNLKFSDIVKECCEGVKND